MFILCIILFIIVFCFVYFLSHYLRKWVDPITFWSLLVELVVLVVVVGGTRMWRTYVVHTHIVYIDWTICANRRAQPAAAAAATRASSAPRRIFARRIVFCLLFYSLFQQQNKQSLQKGGGVGGLHDLIVIIDKVSTCSHSLYLSLFNPLSRSLSLSLTPGFLNIRFRIY